MFDNQLFNRIISKIYNRINKYNNQLILFIISFLHFLFNLFVNKVKR
jgi:hypothetical protein